MGAGPAPKPKPNGFGGIKRQRDEDESGASKHQRVNSVGGLVDLTVNSNTERLPRQVGNIGGAPLVDLTDDGVPATQDDFETERTQPDPNANAITDEKYGAIDSRIVGVQYYTGLATPGEFVLPVREPMNPYDGNAIRILNVERRQVGHLPRDMAARLKPLVDAGTIRLEALVKGAPTYKSMPLEIEVFGPTEPMAKALALQRIQTAGIRLKKDMEQLRREREQIEREKEEPRRLARGPAPFNAGAGGPSGHGFNFDAAGPAAFAGSGGFGGNGTGGMTAAQVAALHYQRLMAGAQAFDPRNPAQVAEVIASPEEVLEKLPTTKQPSKLSTELLPYQLQGLAWLISHEHPQHPTSDTESTQFWTKNGNNYQNKLTMYQMTTKPELASGGILADDMGLGKTLQMIALIAADMTEHTDTVKAINCRKFTQTQTLIVAPVSVMSNWTEQIAAHVSKKYKLKVLTYHGSNKNNVLNLKDYDVVITSYGTLTHAADQKLDERTLHGSGLFSIHWRRVILDEAHVIRNHHTKASFAVRQLLAESRWVLTGTPIVNTLKDLYALVAFLGMTGGIADASIFNRIFVRQQAYRATDKLQELMSTMCLRRTKTMKFVAISLPTREEFIHRIDFLPEERAKYDLLQRDAVALLHSAEKGKAQQKMKYLLEKLLRMRQTCNHWKLAASALEDLEALDKLEKVDYNDENVRLLQTALQVAIDSAEECSICYEPFGPDARITLCKHVYCKGCITQVIDLQHNCPMCRKPLEDTTGKTLIPPRVDSDAEPVLDADADETNSSKITAIMDILTKSRESDPTRKTIVFSQWTSFLNLLEPHLTEAGFHFTRLDGTMNVKQRDLSIAQLATHPRTTILLASLGACSVGINLVSASQVIMSDSWWAPAVEDQAVDRVYRIGQKREVVIWRVVVSGTIEERVLEIQARKRELVALAFREKDERKRRETRLADIQRLLR